MMLPFTTVPEIPATTTHPRHAHTHEAGPHMQQQEHGSKHQILH